MDNDDHGPGAIRSGPKELVFEAPIDVDQNKLRTVFDKYGRCKITSNCQIIKVLYEDERDADDALMSSNWHAFMKRKQC